MPLGSSILRGFFPLVCASTFFRAGRKSYIFLHQTQDEGHFSRICTVVVVANSFSWYIRSPGTILEKETTFFPFFFLRSCHNFCAIKAVEDGECGELLPDIKRKLKSSAMASLVLVMTMLYVFPQSGRSQGSRGWIFPYFFFHKDAFYWFSRYEYGTRMLMTRYDTRRQ